MPVESMPTESMPVESKSIPVDLESFQIVLFCIIEDLYIERFAPLKPIRPGAKPEMSDTEVIMLALLSQWSGKRSERWMINYARKNWLTYFPRILKQSAFNRRVRDLAMVLCALGPAVAEKLESNSAWMPHWAPPWHG